MKTANVRNTMDNPCADASGGGASGGGAATAAAAIGVCVYTHTYADDFFLGGGGHENHIASASRQSCGWPHDGTMVVRPPWLPQGVSSFGVAQLHYQRHYVARAGEDVVEEGTRTARRQSAPHTDAAPRKECTQCEVPEGGPPPDQPHARIERKLYQPVADVRARSAGPRRPAKLSPSRRSRPGRRRPGSSRNRRPSPRCARKSLGECPRPDCGGATFFPQAPKDPFFFYEPGIYGYTTPWE